MSTTMFGRHTLADLAGTGAVDRIGGRVGDAAPLRPDIGECTAPGVVVNQDYCFASHGLFGDG